MGVHQLHPAWSPMGWDMETTGGRKETPSFTVCIFCVDHDESHEILHVLHVQYQYPEHMALSDNRMCVCV